MAHQSPCGHDWFIVRFAAFDATTETSALCVAGRLFKYIRFSWHIWGSYMQHCALWNRETQSALCKADFVASELAWWLSCMCDVEVWHAKGDDSCPAHVQNHCSGATLALSTPAQTLTYASSNKNTNCVSRSHHP
jgi:hypothetical protein